MFKFFRKYNKIILVFGGVLLMVAFLVQGTMQMFYGSPLDEPLGEIDGREITYGDRNQAATELEALRMLNPLLGARANQLAQEDPLQWLLMTRDADRMGLWASESEVNGVLRDLQVQDAQLQQLSISSRLPTGFFRQAVRHWLMLEQYRELVLGQAHQPPMQRLLMMANAIQLNQQLRGVRDLQTMFQLREMVASLAAAAEGSPRVSEPLVKHVLQDAMATVSGQAVVIRASQFADEAEPPSQAELRELFERYRDVPPGQGEPYGLGYRLPDRVRIEYLQVPFDQVRDHVTVDEAEALSYYEEHPEQFRAAPTQPAATQPAATQPAASEPEVTPYLEVRERILDELTDQKAQALATQIIKTASQMMQAQLRAFPEAADGYRQLPADFTPTPLQTVAQQLTERFGVPVQVHAYTSSWVSAEDLATLPGIGQSWLIGQSSVLFEDYVLSAKELEPEADHPLAMLRLQVGVPSEPLSGFDGSQYLFRLTAAEPDRAPASLDEVLPQVTQDAQNLKAYQQLLESKQPQWLALAQEQGLDALAQETGSTVLDIPPTPRHQLGAGSDQTAPSIPGIGSSRQLIDRLFEAAQAARQDDQTDLSQTPASQRIGAVGLDQDMSLVVFRVDRYQPLSRLAYQRQVASPEVAALVHQMLTAQEQEEDSSMSFEAIAARVGYRPAVPENSRESEPDQAEPPATPQPAGSL